MAPPASSRESRRTARGPDVMGRTFFVARAGRAAGFAAAPPHRAGPRRDAPPLLRGAVEPVELGLAPVLGVEVERRSALRPDELPGEQLVRRVEQGRGGAA